MLPILQAKVEGKYCDGCSYQETGIRRVLPDGTGANGVLVVGDSPWISEVAAGRPFAGASGNWLDTILSKRGLQREDFLVANSLWCKPPSLGMNDDPESYPEAQLAQAQCSPYLDDLILERKPKVILALGNVALKRLTGHTDIQYNHAYLFQGPHGIPVIPTFHPSGILQGNHKYTIAFILALAKAIEVASGDFHATKVSLVEDPDPAYITYPANGDLPATLPLMVDIETPKSLAGRNEEEAEDDPSYQIIRMGFSVRAWQGVSFPYEGDYIRRARELTRRARVIICWNKNYDIPRLKANGFNFHPSVQVVDAMWAWHWLYSDLPKALGFAAPFFYSGPAWKHLASQRPAYYNAMDNAVQMGLYQGIKSQLVRDNRWDRFWDHCVRVSPIYIRMGEAGVKVDKAAREVFMDAMASEAHSYLLKVQELVPPNLEYKDKVKVLKREPKVSKAKVKPLKARFLSLVRVIKDEVPAYHKNGDYVMTEGGTILTKPTWVKHNPFNPNSRDHLLALMRHLNIKPPKARGEDRESTEAKYLKRKGEKYPIFRACVNYKQRSKLISTYNWPLDDRDRAHTSYGFHPSTWRSSSRNVNLGNIPKRLELARLFRRLLIADKGCRLIEIDRSAIEAVLVGYWAKSPEYIKLAKAGVHSFLGSHVLGEPIPWEVVRDTPLPDLQKMLKVYKNKGGPDYEAWKRCIHGCVTGEHEVLTHSGWIRLDNLEEGVEVAQWDNGSVSWVKPSRIINQRWIGSMHVYEGRGYSLIATPDHRIPVNHNNKLMIKTASTLGKSGRIPISGILPTTSYESHAGVRAIQLAVAIQADASKGRSTVFHLVKQRKQERLEWLLEGTEYHKVPCGCHPGGFRYSLQKEQIQESLNLLTQYKQFSWDIINLPVEDREIFLSELLFWDGCIKGWRQTYHNTNKQSIDIVQAVCHLTGRQGLIREVKPSLGRFGTKQQYLVSFNARVFTSVDCLSLATANANIPVYCVTVPSGLFLVRHRDRVSVTGNSNYLLSAYGMHDEYEEFFPTEASATKVQRVYFESPAGQAVRSYHKATLEEVHNKHYLDNSFEYRHYFYGPLFKYKKGRGGPGQWEVDHEGDAKRAIAFRPQSDAAAIQREDLLSLEQTWVKDFIRLPTYDSIVLECPNNLADRAVEVLYTQFSKPIPELMGLTVGFEVKVGSNLAPKDDSNPEGMEEVSI